MQVAPAASPAPARPPLRLLVIEDSAPDAFALATLLRAGGWQVVHRRVASAADLGAALRDEPWDLILSDHTMPGFSAPEALRIVQQTGLDVPFIIISGGIEEGVAIETMKAGAHEIGRMGRQTEGDVHSFTSVCLDLDNPDTAEDSLVKLEYALGPAGIIVESSATGKLHAYWLLDEPAEDVQRVARMRHLLALKSGGDPSFQRVPQVIRLPGTMHGKDGVLTPVRLRHANTLCRHMLSGLEERIEAMHPLPWASPDALAKATQGTRHPRQGTRSKIPETKYQRQGTR
jgi:CheY-like chemotaxis protein